MVTPPNPSVSLPLQGGKQTREVLLPLLDPPFCLCQYLEMYKTAGAPVVFLCLSLNGSTLSERKSRK
jgi:hypothetical protein